MRGALDGRMNSCYMERHGVQLHKEREVEMYHKCSLDDERYLRSFEAYEVDAATFHHREHLRVAYALIATYGLESAFLRLKEGLIGFLSHQGVGPEKYHETVTYAWLLAVNHFMHMARTSRSFDEFIQRNEVLLNPSIMATHYSRELLQSTEAKSGFVEPDLDPIPLYATTRRV